MKVSHEIAELGFNNWCELYAHLERQDLLDDEKVTLQWPDKEIIVSVDQVTRQAMAEIWPALPFRVTVDMVIELTNDKRGLRPVVEFLKKIPTKPEVPTDGE